ncbi:MAG TPA: RidA family protein [Burkholderiales bacterium]|nr:RidA family protein [Burkholderiales bacterium]
MSAEKRLKELDLQLPAVTPPVANYVNAVRAGNLLFLAGKGGRAGADGKRPQGKIGREYTVEQGYQQARDTGVELLSVMRHELGSLDRVKRVVKVLGMVNAVPEFQDHPKVINGCSDLFVEVFGEKGRHARSAVGMGSLPMQIPVEIECIVEVEGSRPRRRPAARSAARARRRARR